MRKLTFLSRFVPVTSNVFKEESNFASFIVKHLFMHAADLRNKIFKFSFDINP